MDIQVKNLDLGYTQCENLHTLSNKEGNALLAALSTNIANLKQHWVGNDATVHINNLIMVYQSLGNLLTDAIALTSNAGDKIIAMQTIRRSNGGSGMVGTNLSKNAPHVDTLAKLGNTNEYYCEPLAKNDYSSLVNICNAFDKFSSRFNATAGELMNNWLAGARREQAFTAFDTFDKNCYAYKKILADARENLDIAINRNINQLG